MKGEIEPTKTFEEKLKDRVRDSIGELMTDEDLSKIVHRCTEEIFFTERRRKRGGWQDDEILPPLLHELIKELLIERVNAEVNLFIHSNASLVYKTIKDVVQEGMGTALVNAIRSAFQNDLAIFQMNIEQRFNQP